MAKPNTPKNNDRDRSGRPTSARGNQQAGGRFSEARGGQRSDATGKGGRPNDARRGRRPGKVANVQSTPGQPKDTDEDASEFVFGRHAVEAALKNGSSQTINKFFVQTKLGGEAINTLVGLARSKKILVAKVPKTKLDLLSDGGNHQGVMVAMTPYAYASLDDLFAHAEEAGHEPFFLILDNLEDPHNLGSILRTADAIGVDGVIIPKHRAVGLTSTVAKVSTGAIEHVPVARVTNLAQTIKTLKDRGLWIFGTAMDGQDFRQWSAQGKVALVIGNEGKGISPGVAKLMDQTLTIPMVGHVQSLNASVAAGILMYQAFTSRQGGH